MDPASNISPWATTGNYVDAEREEESATGIYKPGGAFNDGKAPVVAKRLGQVTVRIART